MIDHLWCVRMVVIENGIIFSMFLCIFIVISFEEELLRAVKLVIDVISLVVVVVVGSWVRERCRGEIDYRRRQGEKKRGQKIRRRERFM